MNDVRKYFDETIDALESEISRRRQELKALEKMLELKRELGEKSSKEIEVEREKRTRWMKKEISYCNPFETYEAQMADEDNPFASYAAMIPFEAPKPRIY
ncbi:MAG: hypothetical protein MJ105_06985 [Lachnospiraceae bacterium]|nr:hypothetical protein [Lachnospiraceae bacterium]